LQAGDANGAPEQLPGLVNKVENEVRLLHFYLHNLLRAKELRILWRGH